MNRTNVGIFTLFLVAVLLFQGCTARQMGVNHAGEKLERERPWNEVIGYYIVSRFLDTVDMFTLNVGFGPALHAEAHITQAARLGIGGAYLASIGTGAAPREAGLFGRGIGELTLLPWSWHKIHYDEYMSTGEDFDLTEAAFQGPTQLMYRSKVDYWSIGASGGFLLVGGQAEIHPLQIADWLLGWFTIDFLHDDL
jgi:hypothetical protein